MPQPLYNAETAAEIGLLINLHRARQQYWRQIVADYRDWLVTATCGLLIWAAVVSEIIWPSDLSGTRLACALLAFIAAMTTLPLAAAFAAQSRVKQADRQLAALFANYGLRHVVKGPSDSVLVKLADDEVLDLAPFMAAANNAEAEQCFPTDAELAAGWQPSGARQLDTPHAGMTTA